MNKIKQDLTKILKLKDESIQRIEVKFDDEKLSSVSVEYAISDEAKKMGFGSNTKKDE